MAGDTAIEERQEAGERMRKLYESSFGVSYVRAAAEGAPAATVKTAWCIGPGSATAAGVLAAS